MDRSMHRQHLEEAERHVRHGQQNVLLLERHIRDHELHGRDATLAREVLDTFRVTQTHFLAHRDQILRELNHPREPWQARRYGGPRAARREDPGSRTPTQV